MSTSAGPSTTSSSSSKYPTIVPGGGLILAWQLKGKKVLLVGGGMVAAGRLVNVKDADAHLTVISPRSGLSGEMKHRIDTEKVVDVYHDRSFGGEEDLYDAEGKLYDMVLTAIDDSDLSRSICVMARKLRIPVNVADVPPECDFYFGSLIRRGPLQVMVSTGGKGPKIANQVRTLVERSLPENVGEAISRVGVLRGKLRERVPEQKESGRRMRWMIDVCERWSWDQLAEMTDRDMELILAGWEKGKAPSYVEVKGVTKAYAPTWHSLAKRFFATCPVVGYISPWSAGLLGFAAGAAASLGMVAARRPEALR
ncbi:siroheme synthase middle domains-like protein [Jaminaea rosea]|uniref:precorrin-2 dehydrogenase n=1 Tax=Jaminaea rosea TaxID=1569628 RepID=A0A316UVA4_9BASI|nr:siroheme synthase middle domains-like protein [Jaminaea rosea]PWN28261.1 siroheme synthase middle domains-like protein [Jaminaea rosea]